MHGLSPEENSRLVAQISDRITAVWSGEPDNIGGWTVRVYYEPLVPLIWGGFLVMMLGGLVSLSDRRYRIGAPLRARAIEVAVR